MPETCFVCLQNCSRKVCFVCSCHAHPKCWEEYQSKLSSKICPVCKTDNIVKPYNTRSKSMLYKTEIVESLIRELDSQLFPRNFLINAIQDLISTVHHTAPSNKTLKIEKIEQIMYWLLAGSQYNDSTNLLSESKLVTTLSNRLVLFKRDWPDAQGWHKLLLGTEIN